MFAIPGFDPKLFTDDQIIFKMQELSRRLVYAGRFSTSAEMMSQLQLLYSALEFERRERMQLSMYNIRDRLFPEIIETEPDLKVVDNDGSKKDRPSENAQPRKSIRPLSLTKTAEPLSPGGTSQPKS